MPRPLDQSRPSSAVAPRLDPEVARRALAPAPAHEPSARAGGPDVPPTGEPALLKREFVLTPGADDTLHDLVRLVRRATGATPTASHLLRALLAVLEQARPEIQRHVARIGRLKRPGNARGRESDRDAYERRLAAAISAGIRDASAGP